MSTDLLAFERELWQQGLARVAGVDEAGRGPLAGPVSAAAVILPPAWAKTGLPPELAGLNDSKQLTENQREAFYDFIIHCTELRHAVVLVDAARIDRINILQATHEAMNAALARLSPAPQHALVDGPPPVCLPRSPATASCSNITNTGPHTVSPDTKATAPPSIWPPSPNSARAPFIAAALRP